VIPERGQRIVGIGAEVFDQGLDGTRAIDDLLIDDIAAGVLVGFVGVNSTFLW